MSRLALVLFVSTSLTLGGCGDSKPTPPATDPDNIKRLEAEQKKASQGER